MKYCISKHKYHVCISVLMHYDSFKKKNRERQKAQIVAASTDPKALGS